MNDYSVPLNTMSADCGPFNDYISPLCLISNSAHLELCRDPWTTVPLISSIITLMKFSSVTHGISECECQGPAYSVCTLLLNFNITLIFFTMFPVFPVYSF